MYRAAAIRFRRILSVSSVPGIVSASSKIIHIDFKADFYYNIFRSFWKTRGITDYDNYTGYR